jgi:hypothetical protein
MPRGASRNAAALLQKSRVACLATHLLSLCFLFEPTPFTGCILSHSVARQAFSNCLVGLSGCILVLSVAGFALIFRDLATDEFLHLTRLRSSIVFRPSVSLGKSFFNFWRGQSGYILVLSAAVLALTLWGLASDVFCIYRAPH